MSVILFLSQLALSLGSKQMRALINTSCNEDIYEHVCVDFGYRTMTAENLVTTLKRWNRVLDWINR